VRSSRLLLLAYLAFISLGLPDAVLGVAWPSLRDSFQLPQALLGAPLAAAAVATFISGAMTGRLLQLFSVGALLALSTALVAAGVWGYALAPGFWLILLAAPVIGLGSGAIDAALNTYAAHNFTPRHMSWLHAAYAAGATAGPAIMTAVLSGGAPWRWGYGTVGTLLSVLTLAFVVTRRLWESDSKEVVSPETTRVSPQSEPEAVRIASVLSSPRVWLQIAIFFFYTGIEVCAGQWSYTLLTEGRGFSPRAAGLWVAGYWGGLLAGRVLLGFVVERLGQVRMLRWATVGAVLSAVVFAIPSSHLAVGALPVLSFCLAPIFPGLMTETPRRLGALALHAVGFQVSAATFGVAVMPLLTGWIGQWFGLQWMAPFIALLTVFLWGLHERLCRLTAKA